MAARFQSFARRIAAVWMVSVTLVSMAHSEQASREILVVGHRGASGYVPEHTLVAYFIAAQQGADYIEPDLVMTKDGVLVARHENEIGGTTDVATRPEFAARRTRKLIDGVPVEGWFTEDFTLAELKTLRARERLPQLRPDNTRFDGQFEIPTFDEVLALVQSMNEQRAAAASRLGKPVPKPIGVYPETKHPTYFDGLGLPMQEPLLRALSRWGYLTADAPVLIQSFEVGNLVALSRVTPLPLVQLVEAHGAPYDWQLSGNGRTYADMLTPQGLRDVAAYARIVAVNKDLVLPRSEEGRLGQPTALVRSAHDLGLGVHVWTFRAENYFLPARLRSGEPQWERGNLEAEIHAFIDAGIDGFFVDQPDIGVRSRDARPLPR